MSTPIEKQSIRAALQLAAATGIFSRDELGLIGAPVPVMGSTAKKSAPKVTRLIGWLLRVRTEGKPRDGGPELLYFVSLETDGVTVPIRADGWDRFSGHEPVRDIRVEFWRRYGFKMKFRNGLAYEWDVGDVAELIEPLLPAETGAPKT